MTKLKYGNAFGFGKGYGQGYGKGYGDGSGYGAGYGKGFHFGYGYGDGYGCEGYGNRSIRSVHTGKFLECRGTLITAELLEKQDACDTELDLFKELFPHGAYWPLDMQKAENAGLDLLWAYENLGIFQLKGKS